MSPRAACRLETLGFTEVYDYVPGKAAWFAAGLAVEGDVGSQARAGAVARGDVPTCRLGDPAVEARRRAGDWSMVVVVADDGVVLGLVPTEALGHDPSAPVEDLMSSGPSTFRPSVPCRELASYLAEKDEAHALVTTLDGALVGLASREDLDACAGAAGGDTP
jgi:hypothetical protein